MNNLPLQFLLGCSIAEIMLSSGRALHEEVVWPKIPPFEALARRFLLLFRAHPGLDSIKLTILVQPIVREDNTSHIVMLYQNMKLTTVGDKCFESLDDKMHFLATYAPTYLMGTGTVELTRQCQEVAQVLQDFEAPGVPAAVYAISAKLADAFKLIRVDFYRGHNLG